MLAAALAALLPVAACATANIDTVWDTQVDFGALRTWDWAAKEPETGPALQYESLDAAIRTAVERNLVAAGFRRASGTPSFLVTYYIGVEELTEIPESYYGRGWGGYWGWGWFGPIGLNVSQYDAGTITVDLISPDPAIGLIWRGIARAELTPAAQGTRQVRNAIDEIFDDFPPAR